MEKQQRSEPATIGRSPVRDMQDHLAEFDRQLLLILEQLVRMQEQMATKADLAALATKADVWPSWWWGCGSWPGGWQGGTE